MKGKMKAVPMPVDYCQNVTLLQSYKSIFLNLTKSQLEFKSSVT